MKLRHMISIALFGSAWGFLEATLGGVLHLAHVPFTGTVMASIGFTIMYAALRNGLKPRHLFAVSLVAASFKFLDVWLFSLPILNMQIVNPATAIACQGLAMAAVFHKITKANNAVSLLPRFFAVAAISMIAFNAISIGIYGWPTHHTQNPINAALIQLPSMTILATLSSRGVQVLEEHMDLSMNAGWRAAAAAVFVILAVIVRVYI